MQLLWSVMKMGIRMGWDGNGHQSIKSAKTKLINRKCGRLQSFRLENMTIVTRFPTSIRNADIPKEILHNMFQEVHLKLSD